jgi:hypothetical protein
MFRELIRRIKIYRAERILIQIPTRRDRNIYYVCKWMSSKVGGKRSNRAFRLMKYFSREG